MKKHTLLTALTLVAICGASASAEVTIRPGDINITNLNVVREGNGLNVSFGIDASQLRLKSNQEVTITPVISNGTEIQLLEPVTVAGRNRVYYHLRNDDGYTRGINLFHNGNDAAAINYNRTAPYSSWMDYSTLSLNYTIGGCANCVETGTEIIPVAKIDMRPAVFEAEYIYTQPKAEGVKIRKESGSAYIDFPVNVMEINPGFRNNATELAKISATIDKVRNDKDYTITSIFIKGYASPEGPYAGNERLAKGRTEALLKYVKNLYRFPQSVKFSSGYEAEDWEGLRKWVVASSLEKKDRILAVIDSDLTPDQKDARIKSDFPVDYPFLLQNVYPSLRHSDYVVQYTVREFTDIKEIVALVRTAPQKIGLNEFYLAAQTFQPGSDQYNELFETAVRMYPDDEVANLNAANAAMSRGDLVSARKYLAKAGTSPQAHYTRGIYEALNKNFKSAIEHFNRAKGIQQAVRAAALAKACIDRPEGKVIIIPAK